MLASGARASEGDIVITRRNDRRLHTPRGGWVRNGDRWRITEVNEDGSMRAHRVGVGMGGEVTFPATYVADHVELGYAVTAHRAQGITVDTSHVVVSGTTTRENLYVSMTRGRSSNVAYVALDKPDDSHAAPELDEVTAKTVLYGVLKHTGAELSAHQMIETEQERWSSIAQLAAEYETIAAVAQRDRWIALLENCGLADEQVEFVLASDSFGPLTAELRRAEANHNGVETLLPKLVARRSLEDADDIGAVLISRLRHAMSRANHRRRPVVSNMIAGLIPIADGVMAAEMAAALAERQSLIESRALALAQAALHMNDPWLSRLGEPPLSQHRLDRWLHEVSTVVAYRDRYRIDFQSALGTGPLTDAQKLDAARTRQAIRRARALAEQAAGRSACRRTVTAEAPTIR